MSKRTPLYTLEMWNKSAEKCLDGTGVDPNSPEAAALKAFFNSGIITAVSFYEDLISEGRLAYVSKEQSGDA